MKLKQIFIILAAVLVVLLNLLLFIKNNNSENISINKSVNNQTIDVASSSLTKNNDFSFDISTSTNENGWTVYRNNTCGFEISFPAEFKSSEPKDTNSCDGSLLYLTNSTTTDAYPLGVKGEMSIFLKKIPYINNFSKWLENSNIKTGEVIDRFNGKTKIQTFDYSYGEKKANGIDMQHLNPAEGYPVWIREIFLNEMGSTYVFEIRINLDSEDTLEIFDKILNLFINF